MHEPIPNSRWARDPLVLDRVRAAVHETECNDLEAKCDMDAQSKVRILSRWNGLTAYFPILYHLRFIRTSYRMYLGQINRLFSRLSIDWRRLLGAWMTRTSGVRDLARKGWRRRLAGFSSASRSRPTRLTFDSDRYLNEICSPFIRYGAVYSRDFEFLFHYSIPFRLYLACRIPLLSELWPFRYQHRWYYSLISRFFFD